MSTGRTIRLCVASTLFIGSVAYATVAPAFSYNGCNWGRTSVTYADTTSNTTNIDQAAGNWNARAARLRLNRVFSSQDISVATVDAGNTGWSGLTHGTGGYGSSFTCTTGTR